MPLIHEIDLSFYLFFYVASGARREFKIYKELMGYVLGINNRQIHSFSCPPIADYPNLLL